MRNAAKLKEMTAVNKERVLVLSPGVVESLALQGSQTSLCFQNLKKLNWEKRAKLVVNLGRMMDKEGEVM